MSGDREIIKMPEAVTQQVQQATQELTQGESVVLQFGNTRVVLTRYGNQLHSFVDEDGKDEC